MQLREQMEDFLGGPVVETLTSNARGEGLIPGWGPKLPHASWPKKQNINRCNTVTNSRKIF